MLYNLLIELIIYIYSFLGGIDREIFKLVCKKFQTIKIKDKMELDGLKVNFHSFTMFCEAGYLKEVEFMLNRIEDFDDLYKKMLLSPNRKIRDLGSGISHHYGRSRLCKYETDINVLLEYGFMPNEINLYAFKYNNIKLFHQSCDLCNCSCYKKENYHESIKEYLSDDRSYTITKINCNHFDIGERYSYEFIKDVYPNKNKEVFIHWENKNNIIAQSCRSGDYEFFLMAIETLKDDLDDYETDFLFECAIEGGNKEIVEYLFTRYDDYDNLHDYTKIKNIEVLSAIPYFKRGIWNLYEIIKNISGDGGDLIYSIPWNNHSRQEIYDFCVLASQYDKYEIVDFLIEMLYTKNGVIKDYILDDLHIHRIEWIVKALNDMHILYLVVEQNMVFRVRDKIFNIFSYIDDFIRKYEDENISYDILRKIFFLYISEKKFKIEEIRQYKYLSKLF